ncbi:hypothetical protein [Arsukibacterium sp.]|uniref:hypothetical protein n=1 Tax=Arsukibacterium sp. TaxID=1977258 RepID=UPI001BD6394B|nr:hypothetical protein [Arsukibacterium sp.]
MLINTVTNNNVSMAASANSSNSRIAAAAPLITTNLADTATRQANQTAATVNTISDSLPGAPSQPAERSSERNSESVRVSSSIGRAASAGQLTREQALEIYRNIARFL